MSAEQLITQHIITWTSALQTRSTAGRGNNGKIDLYGIKKLREMILELAVRGKLVPQDPNDEPASELLKRIATEKAELVKQGKIKKQKPLTEISEDEKPFELPVGREWVRISEIGHDWGQKTPDLQFTYIDVGSINKKLGIISEPEIVQAENAPSRARKIVKEGTVVYSTVRPYLLNIAIVSEKFDPEPIASTAFAIIHPFKGIFSNYIYYYLRSSTFITYVEGCQTGIAYPAINDKQFFSGLIAIPPSNEQDLIVNKVGELMALCDQLEQQSLTSLEAHSQLVETLLATLTNSQNAEELAENWARISQHFDTLFTTEASIDALKQTILQLAVMGKLVPQDPNDEPASELLKRIEQEKAQLVKEGKIKKGKAFTKMADKNKHTLPNGWIKCHLGDVIAISSGDGLTLKQMDSDGKIPVYGGNGITGYHNDWNIQKPTIVIGRVGYYCGSIHITPSLAWVTDNAFRTFHSTSNIDIKFLSILLKGTNLKENENATAQPVISASKIYPISIMLPPLNEQKRIFKKFNELISFCEALKSSLHSAQQTQLHLADALTDAALS